LKKIFKYIEQHGMIKAHDKVIVGVSGGADSVCLLFILMKYQELLDFSIMAVHVEHGIRGTASVEDARFAEELCAKWKIPFQLCTFDIPALARKQKLSIEEAGRKARRQSFEEACQEFGGNKIAVAHHAGDQAETVLWNLVRGSGLRGLCGMWPVQGRIIRPLLGVSRSEIERILETEHLAYRTDETNLQDIYTRNKLRLHIIPYMEQELNERTSEHIVQLSLRLQKAESYLEAEGDRRAKELGNFRNGRVEILRTAFMQQEDIMQDYIIRSCLSYLGGGLKDISAQHIESVKRLASRQSGKRLDLPGMINARNQNEIMILSISDNPDAGFKYPEKVKLSIPGITFFHGWKVQTEIEIYKNQIIPKNKYTKWLDYDTIKDTIQLRGRSPGDYFTINEAGGHKKLKNYFIDEKAAKEERDRVLLLVEGSHVLWAVGYRISEAYKITKDTKKILKIQITEVSNGRENSCIIVGGGS